MCYNRFSKRQSNIDLPKTQTIKGKYEKATDAYVNITVSKSNGTDVIGVSDYVCEVSIIPNKKES